MDYYIQLVLQTKLLRVATFVAISYFTFQIITKTLVPFFSRINHFRSFPQNKSNFFLGHVVQLISSASDFVCDQSAKLPNESIIAIWLGWYPLIALVDYQSAEAVLSQPNNRRSKLYRFLGLRDGLICSNGSKWKARRRMIEPFFNTKNMSTFIPIMNESFKKMINNMISKKIQFIDIADNIHRASLDIIIENSMTIPIECEQPTKEQLIEDLEKLETTAIGRISNPLLWSDWYFNLTKMGKFVKLFNERFDRFMETRISERVKQRSGSTNVIVDKSESEMRKDLIDLLLNHYDPNTVDVTATINMAGLEEEMLNLIIAGHDTIATGLRWTLLLLGNNRECQDKLYDEIVHSNIGENRDLTAHQLEDLNRLTYLDQCIKESLRLYPPAPLIFRELDFDCTIGQRYVIPKGTDVIFSYYNIHRDAKVWENPNTFDPDRFSAERFSKIPKYAFLPFGGGKRICIGRRFAMIEMKIFLVHLIRRYSFISTQSVDQVEFEMDSILKPKTPITIKLSLRL